MSRRFSQLLLFAVVTASLAVTGYWLILTSFMVYDDEGYVLWSLRMYGLHGGLYERVFSQYGPFFYSYYDTLHRVLGLSLANDTGRMLTLGYWLIVSTIGGVLTRLLTGSRAAGVAACALTFAGLFAMISEPIHPGGLITLLAMGGAGLGAWAVTQSRPLLFAVATGCASAALALTKINVGVFFMISSASWLLASAYPRRSTGWFLALGCVIAPWLLMRALWPAPWVTHFALIFACGALALVPGILRSALPEHGRSSWLAFAGAGLTVTVLTLALAGVRGTSLAAIWHGTVVAPLSHPGVYFFPVAWLPGSGILAPLSLAICALINNTTLPSAGTRVIAGARLLVCLWFLVDVFHAENEALTRFALSYGPTLAWLMVLPLGGSAASGAARARQWLAWVFVWQTLHAYPVAGSQVGWGTFLWATLLVSGVTEALVVLSRERVAWQKAGLSVVLAGAILAVGRLAWVGHGYFTSSAPLDLPGASSLRPPEDLRRQLRALNDNLTAHCDSLFSLPGMFSLNIWSGRPTPTGANVTHWFSLLSEAEQQDIVRKLHDDPRAGLVVHRYLLDRLHREGFSTESPLRTYLDTAFEPVVTIGDYELHLHRGRTIAALSTARRLVSEDGRLTAIELVVSFSKETTVSSAGLQSLHRAGTAAPTAQPSQGAPWIIQKVSADGTALGEPVSSPAPFGLHGITRITIPLSSAGDWPRSADTCVVLFDPSGKEIAAAFFVR